MKWERHKSPSPKIDAQTGFSEGTKKEKTRQTVGWIWVDFIFEGEKLVTKVKVYWGIPSKLICCPAAWAFLLAFPILFCFFFLFFVQALHKGNSCQLLRCSKYLHGMRGGILPPSECVRVRKNFPLFHAGRRKSKGGPPQWTNGGPSAAPNITFSRLHFALKLNCQRYLTQRFSARFCGMRESFKRACHLTFSHFQVKCATFLNGILLKR